MKPQSERTRNDAGGRSRRLVLVNQFKPPASPPTAKLLGDLAEAAQTSGWRVTCLGRRKGYGPMQGWRRYLRDLLAHLRIGWGLLWMRRPDLIVCLSDPPCLPVTVAVMACLRRAPVIHWAMDVYPQTAVALGQLRVGAVSRLLSRCMIWAYRRCRRVVALDRDMADLIGRLSNRPVEVMPPWPPRVKLAETPPDLRDCRSDGLVWLYSGNLGRAHDWQTMLGAQRLLEQRANPLAGAPNWTLVLQGGGAAMDQARLESERMGLCRVEFRPYASEVDLLPALLDADVLIATLNPDLRGLLWPSKLALMRLCGRPIAWIGPVEGAIAEHLRGDGMNVCFAPGEVEGLAAWLQGNEPAGLTTPPAEIAEAVDHVRRQTLEHWNGWLDQP